MSKSVTTSGLVCAFAIVAALALGSASASADTILKVSESGVWASDAPTTIESAPNESWSFSFNISPNPTPTSVDPGNGFDTDVFNFQYTLDGAPVATLPQISWGNISAGGLIGLSFADGFFQIDGAQAYTGSESDPTIIPGIYPLSSDSEFIEFGNDYGTTPLTGDLTIADVTTPEPSSFFLLGTGLLAVCGDLTRRRLRRSRQV